MKGRDGVLWGEHTDEAKDIERRIAELKSRWPSHSVPPRMWQELEELESELERIERDGPKEDDGGQEGARRLPQV
jgi:hypothetical protein